MKIIQTFWTARQDPLRHGFGWTHPEYNLMSWSLSCLSLREHYDEVELYTDSAGYHILIEVLQLPYTKTHVIFDDFQCLPHHWALSKIKTYSLQTEPFLHIDGDIYLPRPLPERVLNAPLVAQNREIGTRYYRRMMDEGVLKHPSIKLPEYIKKGLREDSIASYNMGFFGGTDLGFIQEYCDEVFRFMEINSMNNAGVAHAHVNCNVFFEQVVFALFADQHNRKVCGLLEDVRQDKGYTFNEFCDLTYYKVLPFFHILGGHKRNEKISSLFETTLVRHNPELYKKILSLFPERNIRFKNIAQAESDIYHSVEYCMAMYEDWKLAGINTWQNIAIETLLQNAHVSSLRSDLLLSDEVLDRITLSINPKVQIFDIPEYWNPAALKILKKEFGIEKDDVPFKRIALLPCLSGKGYKEMALSPYEIEILEILESKPLSQKDILTTIKNKKNGYVPDVIRKITDIYKNRIRNLIIHEVLL